MTARTILQNIEVFSTGDSAAKDSKDKPAGVPVFNLLVTPKQAEALSQAVAQTRIALVLRNPLDKENLLSEIIPEAHLPTAALQKVFHNAPKPEPRAVTEPKTVAVAPPVPAPLPTIEVIHGTKRTVSAVAPSSSEPQQ